MVSRDRKLFVTFDTGPCDTETGILPIKRNTMNSTDRRYTKLKKTLGKEIAIPEDFLVMKASRTFMI